MEHEMLTCIHMQPFILLFQSCGLAHSAERDELAARLRADVCTEEGGHGRRVLDGNLQEQIHLQPADPRSGRNNRIHVLFASHLYVRDHDFCEKANLMLLITCQEVSPPFQAHESAQHYQRRTSTRTPSSSIGHQKCRNRPSERRETAFFDTKRRSLPRSEREGGKDGGRVQDFIVGTLRSDRWI